MPSNYVVTKGKRYIADTIVEHHQTENGAVAACSTYMPGTIEMSPPPSGFSHYFTNDAFDFYAVVTIDVLTP